MVGVIGEKTGVMGDHVGVIGENGGAAGDWHGEPTSRSPPGVMMMILGGGRAARNEDGILTRWGNAW